MKKAMAASFIKAGEEIFRLSAGEKLEIARIESGVAVLHVAGKSVQLVDFDAFEAVMKLHPAALEGRRLRWPRHAWAFHNLVAHPVMQILVWLGFTRAGIWVHDVTVPHPVGIRKQPT